MNLISVFSINLIFCCSSWHKWIDYLEIIIYSFNTINEISHNGGYFPLIFKNQHCRSFNLQWCTLIIQWSVVWRNQNISVKLRVVIRFEKHLLHVVIFAFLYGFHECIFVWLCWWNRTCIQNVFFTTRFIMKKWFWMLVDTRSGAVIRYAGIRLGWTWHRC